MFETRTRTYSCASKAFWLCMTRVYQTLVYYCKDGPVLYFGPAKHCLWHTFDWLLLCEDVSVPTTNITAAHNTAWFQHLPWDIYIYEPAVNYYIICPQGSHVNQKFTGSLCDHDWLIQLLPSAAAALARNRCSQDNELGHRTSHPDESMLPPSPPLAPALKDCHQYTFVPVSNHQNIVFRVCHQETGHYMPSLLHKCYLLHNCYLLPRATTRRRLGTY